MLCNHLWWFWNDFSVSGVCVFTASYSDKCLKAPGLSDLEMKVHRSNYCSWYVGSQNQLYCPLEFLFDGNDEPKASAARIKTVKLGKSKKGKSEVHLLDVTTGLLPLLLLISNSPLTGVWLPHQIAGGTAGKDGHCCDSALIGHVIYLFTKLERIHPH